MLIYILLLAKNIKEYEHSVWLATLYLHVQL